MPRGISPTQIRRRLIDRELAAQSAALEAGDYRQVSMSTMRLNRMANAIERNQRERKQRKQHATKKPAVKIGG